MITVIPKKNKIAAEIICDVKNLKNSEIKKNSICIKQFWNDLFQKSKFIFKQLFKIC